MTKRLDLLVMERFGCSRVNAREAIEKSLVRVDGVVVAKPGRMVDEAVCLEAEENIMPRYVSRGGYKLEKALEAFQVSVVDKVCLDVGASTGGFTHCLLMAGAKKVYALDNGIGQLSPALLADSRVVNLEKTNIRTLETDLPPFDLVTVDVSFISLTKVLEPAASLLSRTGEMICLIKPQFEAGRKALNKKGVVTDLRVHEKVKRDLMEYAEMIGLVPAGLIPSPICGGDGNREYLLHLH